MFDSKGGGTIDSIRNKYHKRPITSTKTPDISLTSCLTSRELTSRKSKDLQFYEDRSPRPSTALSARNPKPGKICRNKVQTNENKSKIKIGDDFWSSGKKYETLSWQTKTMADTSYKPKLSQKKVSFNIGQFSLQKLPKKGQNGSSHRDIISMKWGGKGEVDSLKCIQNVEQLQMRIKNIFLAN